jgi:hypothetical protein
MTSICFIGDSHLATLKFGLPLLENDCPDIEPVFFASHGKSMTGIALSGGALVATNEALLKSLKTTSGGHTAIRSEYDCYVIHGLELSVTIPLLLMRTRKTGGDITHLSAHGESSALREQVAAAIKETIAVKILTMLRKITSAPAFLSPAPISSLQLPALRERLAARGRNEGVIQMFEGLCREVAEGADARFLPQPACTRTADGMATQQIYSQRPARFKITQPVEDKSHMNAQYGVAVLRDFLAAASLSQR